MRARDYVDLELADRGALVVGASGDIGRAVVARLGAEGARVAIAGRSRARMATMPKGAMDNVVGAIDVDLRDDASIMRAAAEAESLLEAVDVLVCSVASDAEFGAVWGASRADWESEMALKCIGTARMCTEIAKQMVARGSGVIVNLIGIATDMVVTQNPLGGAANAALRSFTRVLAAEVAGSGVRVIGVSPGMTAGGRLNRFAAEQLEAIRASIPLGAIGQPEEIADVVVFMASPRASYITGAILNVDGGLTLIR